MNSREIYSGCNNRSNFSTQKGKPRWTQNAWELIFWITIIIALLTLPCLGSEDNESISAGKVTVTDVLTEPAILITGDVGVITFTVENTGSSNVAISDAELISKDITVLNPETYKSTRVIGAGTEMKFTFTILANQPENIYYPAFYLNYKNAGSLRYNIPVRVEEPQLALAVAGLPQTFSQGVKSTITLQIGNAKSVNMTGIEVIPSGNNLQYNRTSCFIGDLGPHAEKAVQFEIIPSASTEMKFNVSYTCGMNSHRTSYSVPITVGIDKLAAEPLLNNIEISSDTTGSKLSGDVSNAGLSDAYGVVIALESALGQDANPNQKYAIGTITSGDFESFELVIPQEMRKVPIVIQYKDSSGNTFAKNSTLDIDQISGVSASGVGGINTQGEFPGGSLPQGAPQSGASQTGSSSSGSGGTRTGGINPMNPLSNVNSGLSNISLMDILYGVGIVAVAIIAILIWRKRAGKNKKSQKKTP